MNLFGWRRATLRFVGFVGYYVISVGSVASKSMVAIVVDIIIILKLYCILICSCLSHSCSCHCFLHFLLIQLLIFCRAASPILLSHSFSYLTVLSVGVSVASCSPIFWSCLLVVACRHPMLLIWLAMFYLFHKLLRDLNVPLFYWTLSELSLFTFFFWWCLALSPDTAAWCHGQFSSFCTRCHTLMYFLFI